MREKEHVGIPKENMAMPLIARTQQKKRALGGEGGRGEIVGKKVGCEISAIRSAHLWPRHAGINDLSSLQGSKKGSGLEPMLHRWRRPRTGGRKSKGS